MHLRKIRLRGECNNFIHNYDIMTMGARMGRIFGRSSAGKWSFVPRYKVPWRGELRHNFSLLFHHSRGTVFSFHTEPCSAMRKRTCNEMQFLRSSRMSRPLVDKSRPSPLHFSASFLVSARYTQVAGNFRWAQVRACGHRVAKGQKRSWKLRTRLCLL